MNSRSVADQGSFDFLVIVILKIESVWCFILSTEYSISTIYIEVIPISEWILDTIGIDCWFISGKVVNFFEYVLFASDSFI